MSKSLTKAEKLLLAAARLEERGVRPFSAEDLVVEAWKNDPDAFGLQGYQEYPDSNRVYAEIMGSKPLRSRGWIEKKGGKLYQLAEAGRYALSILSTSETATKGSRASLSRDQLILLRRLLSSRAVRKASVNNIESISFPDACAFWGISPRSNANTFQTKLQSVNAILQASRESIQEKGSLELTHAGTPIGAETIQQVANAHRYMLEAFDDEIEIILARKDERRIHN